MPDELDIAEQQSAALLQHAILMASQRAHEADATGRCLNCDEKVKKGVRWCNQDCCTDWTKRNERKAK